jgi:C4-type Zn-finger protein
MTTLQTIAAKVEETYESEGPKCPYCGRQYTADEDSYFDEINYTEEVCDNCERAFDVSVYTSTTWTCTPRALSATSREGE